MPAKTTSFVTEFIALNIAGLALVGGFIALGWL